MDTENIVSIITTGVNLITIICYTITIIFKKQKSSKNALNNIIKTIPAYITQAKSTLTNATNKTVLNFVLAEIKDDFEEILTKKSESKVKKQIEEELENA